MWQFNCHCEENRLDKAAWWGSSLCSVFISTTSGISCQCLATEIELEAGTYVRQCGQVQRVRATLPSISDCSSVVLAPVWQCPRQSPQSLSYSPCSSHPEHFYISLRRHLLQFLPSSWLHIELSKIACHHDHVIITWNGCKSGGRLGWWTRKSWKDSSTFTLLSKISGSPPHNSEHLLKCIWNIQQEVKCTAIAKYKLQTPPLHHLPACWHEWEVRKCVKTQRKPSAIVLFGLGNSILARVRWKKDAQHTSIW